MAEKINNLELKLSEIYTSINLLMKVSIENSNKINKLKEDTIGTLLLLYEKIDNQES